jgi:hypothetical protein
MSLYHCFKHGDYDTEDTPLQGYNPCPKCEDVRAKDICVECEKHKATTTFANSTMNHIHGFTERICRCCYLALVSDALKKTQENFNRLTKELQEKPCETV